MTNATPTTDTASNQIVTALKDLGFNAGIMDGTIYAEDADRECGLGLSTVLFGCSCGPALVTVPTVTNFHLEMEAHYTARWYPN